MIAFILIDVFLFLVFVLAIACLITLLIYKTTGRNSVETDKPSSEKEVSKNG